MSRFITYIPVALFTVVTLLILGPMLVPGYVLTLDMSWPTDLAFTWNVDGLNNTLPLTTFLYLLGTIVPSWIVQKIVLIGLFFALLYVPYRFLPFIATSEGRIFAGLLYTLNPFVYSRILAGQWTVLLGYAFLPLVLGALVRITERRDTRSAFILAGALIAVGAVSIHFLYLSIVLSVVWISIHIARSLSKSLQRSAWPLTRSALVAVGIFVFISMYWLVPAFTRVSPLEARFDIAHFSGFSASENGTISTPLNLAVLGGFWGEGMEWHDLFLWPQDSLFFWFASIVLCLLIVYGLYLLLHRTETRMAGWLVLGLGIAFYVLALGVGPGTLSSLNLWWYTHVPGWSGLRDSHKIAGMLALFYALCAGVGVSHLLQQTRIARWRGLLVPIFFMVPVFFGIHEWYGFRGQLAPVWYPASWYEAREILAHSSQNEKVLVLPWRGYFSLPFAEQRIVSNPTPRFFGVEKVFAGRSVEVGSVYDQEVDAEYRALDALVHGASGMDSTELTEAYRVRGIRYILIIENPKATNRDAWHISQTEENTASVNALLQVPNQQLLSGEVSLYLINY